MRSALSRRSFLAATSLAAGAAATLPLPPGPARSIPENRDAFEKPTWFDQQSRLTISMWDFSWLTASHPGGPFEDLERRATEALERGYNTLRIDCFPSRVLQDEARFEKNWSPGEDLPQWGQCAQGFCCNVRQRLAGLTAICRKNHLWLGLDCWDKGHMFAGKSGCLNGDGQLIAPGQEEAQFTRYGETWARALRLLREEGVLERAVWVAPMNEVPHFASRHLESLRSAVGTSLHEGQTELERNRAVDAVYRRINEWMALPIKAELGPSRIPISYSSLGAENFAARLTDVYDLVDVHFMPGVILDKEDEAAFEAVHPGAAGFVRFAEFKKYNLREYSRVWDRACQKNYPALLRRALDYHQAALRRLTLPSGKKLEAVITESFGPCFWPDHPAMSWEWYKLYNGDALRIISGLDYRGSSLSNYAEPLFSIWTDAPWHYAANQYFLHARS